jgi:hypothetical protein
VISSGDSEEYAHPRPLVVGAAGLYGRPNRSAKGAVLPPLVYSTELARSHMLRNVIAAERVRDPANRAVFDPMPIRDVRLVPESTWQMVGNQKRPAHRWLVYCPVATKYVYGLVNVRTDGDLILCATMLEQGDDFDVKVFRAGVDV